MQTEACPHAYEPHKAERRDSARSKASNSPLEGCMAYMTRAAPKLRSPENAGARRKRKPARSKGGGEGERKSEDSHSTIENIPART